MVFRKLLVFFVLFSFTFILASQTPYEKLSKRIFDEHDKVSVLSENSIFENDKKEFDTYTSEVERARVLRSDIEEGNSETLSKEYLFVLRKADKSLKKIEHLYFKKLSQSIEEGDKKSFLYLSNNHLSIINKESISKRVCTFYKSECKGSRSQFLDTLVHENKTNEIAYSEQLAASEEYAENLEVISSKELEAITKESKSTRKQTVVVASEKTKDGFTYVASNFFNYRVSVSLKFEKLENFALSKAQPIYFELAANETKQIVKIRHIDKRKAASASPRYSVVMGSASAIHDDSILYRLPFAKKSKIVVSQGFNGVSTHSGLSAYSVDFSVPEGTPIHAARSGVVFATQSIHDKGGFAKKFGIYANYVIVEHSDKTLGKYWHLKKDGVAVRVGQKVEVGTLLGYSGNTGYSSGPHLHFNVSMVDPVSNRLPKSIPIRFKTKEGVVTEPKRGDIYSVL